MRFAGDRFAASARGRSDIRTRSGRGVRCERLMSWIVEFKGLQSQIGAMHAQKGNIMRVCFVQKASMDVLISTGPWPIKVAPACTQNELCPPVAKCSPGSV